MRRTARCGVQLDHVQHEISNRRVCDVFHHIPRVKRAALVLEQRRQVEHRCAVHEHLGNDAAHAEDVHRRAKGGVSRGVEARQSIKVAVHAVAAGVEVGLHDAITASRACIDAAASTGGRHNAQELLALRFSSSR